MSIQNFTSPIYNKHPLFNIGASCAALGFPEKCTIVVDNDGNITSFGPWQRGTFAPRADIAGPGVSDPFSLIPGGRTFLKLMIE